MSAQALAAAAPEAVAKGSAARRSLWEFVRESGLQSLVVGLSKDPNGKLTLLLVPPGGDRPTLAIKAPTTERAARAVEAETRMLRELGMKPPGPLLETVPRVVDVLDFEGRPALVMTAVHGVPMTALYMRAGHTASLGRVAADFAAAGDWLADFQGATCGQGGPLELDGGVTDNLLSRFGDDAETALDVERLMEIQARLRGETVPRTSVHGDLWLGNLLITRGRVSGVVDWEAGSTSGEPVRDLVRFALMYGLYLDRRTRPGRRVRGHRGLRAGRRGAALEFAIHGSGWFPELFRGFIGDGLARLGASPAAWRDAALAGIAEVAAFTDDPSFGRVHLELFRRLARGGPGQRQIGSAEDAQ